MDKALFDFLTEKDKKLSDCSDAMWRQRLEDYVAEWNNLHGTGYEPYETWLEFVKSGDKNG